MTIAGTDERTFKDNVLTVNDTAVPVGFDQSRQIDNLLELLPNTRHIAVAIGDSPLERFWVAELQRSFERFSKRVTFHWLNKLSFDEMVRRVSELPPDSAIYYATVRIDAQGAPQEEDRVLARFQELGRAPIFTYIDNALGRGIVGGPMFSTREIARQSAAVAARILGGESPGTIKTPTIGLAAPVYDWRELRRWHISEAMLPAGSIIEFRQPTMWEQYRWQVFALIAAIVLQAALIVWLLIEHQRRQRAEVVARNTISELTHMNRVATAGELSASIAHEVVQPLTGITARASAALRWLATDKPDLEKVRNALTQIVSASDRASDIVTSIRSMFKKDAGKRVAIDINRLILTVLEIARIEREKNAVELQTELAYDLPPVQCDKVQLQQVILNLVVNAIESMHASPTRTLRVRSTLSRPGMVSVAVEDTGTGIDPANRERIFKAMFTTKAQGIGMGLSICNSIIEGHGGHISLSSTPGRGSVFQFELPTAVAAVEENDLAVVRKRAAGVAL